MQMIQGWQNAPCALLASCNQPPASISARNARMARMDYCQVKSRVNPAPRVLDLSVEWARLWPRSKPISASFFHSVIAHSLTLFFI